MAVQITFFPHRENSAMMVGATKDLIPCTISSESHMILVERVVELDGKKTTVLDLIIKKNQPRPEDPQPDSVHKPDTSTRAGKRA